MTTTMSFLTRSTDARRTEGHWLWPALRPQTLTLAAAPVMMGAALAWADGGALHWMVFVATLAAALCIQAGTNLYNDVFDAERGTDGPQRAGPVRVTAAGLAAPAQVRRAAHSVFALAFVLGLLLVAVGGWPILVIGLASLLAGYAYSGGPKPLSHTPWGELFVLVFFGILAVSGSYFLQAGRFTLAAVWLGVALGLQASAVLLVNNVRDLDTDRDAGRVTLAGVIGDRAARGLYALLILLPFPMLWLLPETRGLWLPWMLLPLCLWLAWSYRTLPRGAAMNRHLARSAQVQVLFAVAVGVALLWPGA
jgi:1,4-dihydroxy-2-naphthoate octaprenyltransferase